MNELISVIIPAYNVGQYLENCLNSVLCQTYLPIEILLIDDGSSDETAEIADYYQKKHPDKIHVFHTVNSGVTSARLKGIQEAKGEWIGFVDGDDEIEPDMYERLFFNVQKYHADISHCGHIIIVNNGERIHEFYNTGRLSVQDQKSALIDLLDGPIEPGLWNKLFHRSLFYKSRVFDILDKSIKYNEDLLMNFYLFSAADKSVYEDFCGYHYMARDYSATRSGFRIEKILDPVKVRKIILDTVGPEMKDIGWHMYLSCCLRSYNNIRLNPAYEENAEELRNILISNRAKWKVLRKKELFKLYGLLYFPKVTAGIIRIYRRVFQKIIYE